MTGLAQPPLVEYDRDVKSQPPFAVLSCVFFGLASAPASPLPPSPLPPAALSPKAETSEEKSARAELLLSQGTVWEALPPELKSAHANTRPEEAVRLAGAAALNLMDKSVLSPDLVRGFVRHDGSWKKPHIESGKINSSTLMSLSSSWVGWGRQFPVVRVKNPLEEAEVVGTVSVVAVTSNGSLAGHYYTGKLEEGKEGVSMKTLKSDYGTGFGEILFEGGDIRVVRPW